MVVVVVVLSFVVFVVVRISDLYLIGDSGMVVVGVEIVVVGGVLF